MLKLIQSVFIVSFLLFSYSFTFAAPRYWVNAIGGNWNNPNNWSASPPPGHTPGASVPGAGDVATFNGLSGFNGICTFDMSPTILSLQLVAGYTGHLDLNGYNLNIAGNVSTTLAASSIRNNGVGGGTITINNTNGGNISLSNTHIFSNTSLAVTLNGTAIFTCGAATTMDANLLVTLNGAGATFTGGFTAGGLDCVFNGTVTVTTAVLAGHTSFTGNPGAVFMNTVNVTARSIFLNGSTYEQIASFTKTGNGSDLGNGGNIFKEQTTIINRSNNNVPIRTATANPDMFEKDVYLACIFSGIIDLAYSDSTYFNGNIRVYSDPNANASSKIRFGEGGGASILADGFTIAEVFIPVVAPDGFTRGTLSLSNFTQFGSTPQYLHLGGPIPGNTYNTTLILGTQPLFKSTFNGSVDFSATNLHLNGCIFNGAATTLSKIQGGTGLNPSQGGNVFNSVTTTINNSSGGDTNNFQMAMSAGDDFNGNVIFNPAINNSLMTVCQTGTNKFAGNITISSASTNAVTFGANGGIVVLDSLFSQSINLVDLPGNGVPPSPTFATLRLNKTSSDVTLNTSITVSNNLDLIDGVLFTTASSYPTLLYSAGATGGSINSYVDGPIRKTATPSNAFTFPVGDDGVYRPIAISAPLFDTQFEASFIRSNPRTAVGTNLGAGLSVVSGCEYWILNRITPGGADVNVTLGWNSSDCNGTNINSLPDLRVARWNGIQWVSHGNSTTSGDAAAGTITSNLVSSFSPFTLGSFSLLNALPIELILFKVTAKNNEAELLWRTSSEINNNYFTVERSDEKGIDFIELGKLEGAGTTNQLNEYHFIDPKPLRGKSYYRLKQTDFDGSFSYSKVISFYIENSEEDTFYVYPVPAIGPVVHLNRKYDVEVFTSTGIKIFKGINVDNIDVSGFLSGVYYVMNQHREVKRMIIR